MSSKIGVVVKVKAGAVKVRLVHDLRRSGVNAKVQMKERIVLPRLTDVAADTLQFLAQPAAESCDYMV